MASIKECQSHEEGVEMMEKETSRIVVLDEGIEESADSLCSCCKTGQNRAVT